jgi:hypothetical protein
MVRPTSMSVSRWWLGSVACAVLSAGCPGDDASVGSGTETETGTGSGTGTTGPSTSVGTTPTSTSVGTMEGSGSDTTVGSLDTGSTGDSGSSGSSSDDTTSDMCPGTQPGCVVDWAGQFGQMGDTDGIGQAARFNGIAGITSVDDFVYVTANHAIRRIDVDTADVTTWAGQSGQMAHADGMGNAARFANPAGLSTDGTVIWVADAGNAVIREIDVATGQVSTIAGQVGNPGNNDGMAGATFDGMRDLAWDGSFLYLVQGNGVVRRVDPGNGAVVTVAGQPNTNGFMDGQGGAVRFDVPRHIEAIGPDTFYIADTENHRVRLMVVSGMVGDVTSPYGGGAGYQDGNGNNALFRRHRGLAYDGTGLLAVADSDNFVIREADLGSGDVTTIAGMAGNANHVVGVGLGAGFDKPLDMHYDAATGDLFISEGNVLRRMYYQ